MKRFEVFEGDYLSLLLGNRLVISISRYRNEDMSVDMTAGAEVRIHYKIGIARITLCTEFTMRIRFGNNGTIKALIVLSIIIMMCIPVTGCLMERTQNGSAPAEPKDEPVSVTTTDSAVADLEILSPTTSADAENEEETSGGGIDIGNLRNWEKAYLYIRNLRKPVAEFSGNYAEWKFSGNWDGGVYFTDPVDGMGYCFVEEESDGLNENYYEAVKTIQLRGDRPCYGIMQTMGYFFPEAEWPIMAEGTNEYLTEYLGLRFVRFAGESDPYSGIYHAVLQKGKFSVSIESEAGVISASGTSIAIFALDDSQYQYWERSAQ
jgi:hypothetical protein